MFEHTWAIPLAAAIRRAGGVPLAQGFVTPEALVMVGEELNAIAEAETAIEVSEIVKSAAILDTLATLEEAEAIKTAIAADVLRTLAVAESDRGGGGRGGHRDPGCSRPAGSQIPGRSRGG